MATKRRQSENGKTEKRKKKSCEETPQLCSAVRDEQVKAAVKEAWSQRSSYIQGRSTNTTSSQLQQTKHPVTANEESVKDLVKLRMITCTVIDSCYDVGDF